jgi:hypothetical protein
VRVGIDIKSPDATERLRFAGDMLQVRLHDLASAPTPEKAELLLHDLGVAARMVEALHAAPSRKGLSD